MQKTGPLIPGSLQHPLILLPPVTTLPIPTSPPSSGSKPGPSIRPPLVAGTPGALGTVTRKPINPREEMNDRLVARYESVLAPNDQSRSSRSTNAVQASPSPPAFADIHIDIPSELVIFLAPEETPLLQRPASISSVSVASTTSSDYAILNQTFWKFAWDFLRNFGGMLFEGDRRRRV